jgi:hypothetical protein
MEILEKILREVGNRKNLISEFQELIWNDPNSNDIFINLAYELDFYEPNVELRKEDASYFGDERLEEEIIEALNKLRKQV